jgi:RNA polymerase sigma factor (sigma-70 family)
MTEWACLDRDAEALASDPGNISVALGWARHYQKKFPGRDDDFESAALLALVEAARAFDPANGATFRTLLGSYIHFKMIDVYKSSLPLGFRRPDERRDFGRPPRLFPIDARAEFAAPDADAEAPDPFERLIEPLPDPHRVILRARFCDGLSQRQVAKQLKCSNTQIMRMERHAFDTLRRRAEVLTSR